MRLLLTMLFLLPSLSFAECLQLQKDSLKLQWTGYKTATKAGVSGTFTDVKYNGKSKGKDLAELVDGAVMTIGLSTPSSGDASRDANLKNHFFKLIGDKATAKVKGLQRGYLRVDLTMGKKTVEVALKPEIKDGEIKMNGTLDILDFALNDAFASISKQCRALHEGKTWSDVAIEVTAKTTACK